MSFIVAGRELVAVWSWSVVVCFAVGRAHRRAFTFTTCQTTLVGHMAIGDLLPSPLISHRGRR